MPLEKSALSGLMNTGTTFQRAPGEVTPAVPGNLCLQCGGNLIRMDGELSCGRCGLSANDERAKRFVQTVGLHSQNAELLQKQQAMEAEIEALKAQVVTLQETASTVNTDSHPAPKKHRRE